jgi:DNA-binding NtrC family response regulator
MAKAKHASKKKRILLVGGIRSDYITALKRNGYSVDGPCALEEAWFRCARKTFDLILLDLVSDPRSAFRLCGHVRQQSPRSCVVFMLDSRGRTPAITCPPNDVIHQEQGVEHMLERVGGLLAA